MFTPPSSSPNANPWSIHSLETETLGSDPIVDIEDADSYGGAGNRVMLAVEIPLIVLAICTVALRGYSRVGIKRRLAADDVLIILGTICAFGRTVISCLSADDSWGFDIRGLVFMSSGNWVERKGRRLVLG